MAHELQDGRNIREAEDEWDNDGITFHSTSNVHSLVGALLSEADRIDDDLTDTYEAQHINDATGEALDEWGTLVQTPRNTGESDASYRARIKARARIGNMNSTFDEFTEFAAEVLETDIDNLFFDTPYVPPEEAEVQISADPSVYSGVNLTGSEAQDILDDAVPAGHEVQLFEGGTFRLKEDGEADDPALGLTSDSISTGGTLAEDVV